MKKTAAIAVFGLVATGFGVLFLPGDAEAALVARCAVNIGTCRYEDPDGNAVIGECTVNVGTCEEYPDQPQAEPPAQPEP